MLKVGKPILQDHFKLRLRMIPEPASAPAEREGENQTIE